MPDNKNLPSPQDVEGALDEIDNNLHKMLLLAELSASGLKLDRDAMQKTLEHLKDKIDRIADGLENA